MTSVRGNPAFIARWLAVASALLIVVNIARLAPGAFPIKPGNSEQFWRAAAYVDLSPEVADDWVSTGRFIDRWAIYDKVWMHNSDLSRLPREQAMADFPVVIQKLREAPKDGERAFIAKGFETWQKMGRPNDVDALIVELRRARDRQLGDADISAYYGLNKDDQDERLLRANWFWATLVFDTLLLWSLVLLLLWPAMFALRTWRWALHWGLAPLAFLLPAYLGYATYTFTGRGPSGGVLYPWLLCFARGGKCNGVDEWILARLPQLLEPLSVPLGSAPALSGSGMPGPTTAIGVGAVLAGLVAGARWMLIKRQKVVKAIVGG